MRSEAGYGEIEVEAPPRFDRLRVRLLDIGGGRQAAHEVIAIDGRVQQAIDGMLDLMRRARYTALAGPVVGLPLRVIAIDLSETGRSQVVLINPVIEEVSTERQRDREGCLAVPGVTAPVDRGLWVVVSGLTRSGQQVRLRAGGMLARMVQHQVDHLDGRSFIDHLPWRSRLLIEARLRRQQSSCRLHSVQTPPRRETRGR